MVIYRLCGPAYLFSTLVSTFLSLSLSFSPPPPNLSLLSFPFRYEALLRRISDVKLNQLLPQVQNYCPGSAPPLSLLSPTTAQSITSRAIATSKLFLEMGRQGERGGGGGEGMAVREINLGNYIEHLTYTILHSQSADLLKLPLFLRECF